MIEAAEVSTGITKAVALQRRSLCWWNHFGDATLAGLLRCRFDYTCLLQSGASLASLFRCPLRRGSPLRR